MPTLRLFLPFLAIIGFGSFFSHLFRQPLSASFFAVTAFIGVAEFVFALTGFLEKGTFCLLLAGCFLLIYTGWMDFCSARQRLRGNWLTIVCYLSLVILIAIFATGLRFRSIDDYSFWGVMSRYLYLFGHLPTDASYISDRYLTYTPGMACLHYFFYYAMGQYSQYAGYLGQNALLIAAFMVFFDEKKIKSSLVEMALVFIFLVFAFGTVFARMEVDAYVATCVFAISWMIFRQKSAWLLLFPILFLSLIKETGLFFSLILALGFYICQNKSRKNLFFSAIFLAGLIGIKLVWVLHCRQYGFQSFAAAVHLDNALAVLNPFNPAFHGAQGLFIKKILTASSSRQLAGFPNLVIYLLMGAIWYFLSRNMDQEAYKTASRLKWIYLAGLAGYLMMLYLLQTIVFDSVHTGKLLDFERYFNMLFFPFVIFTLLLYFQEKMKTKQSMPPALFTGITSLALIFIISGKVERTLHYYQAGRIENLVGVIHQSIPSGNTKTICLQNPPAPAYDTLLPLAYFFMPQKIKLDDDGNTCHYRIKWTGADLTSISRLTQSA